MTDAAASALAVAQQSQCVFEQSKDGLRRNGPNSFCFASKRAIETSRWK
jgi:hypothetical protein